MKGVRRLLLAMALAAVLGPVVAEAQGTVVEGHVGGVRFNGENAPTHRAAGGAVRRYVTPRLGLVPYLSLSEGLMHDANAVGASTPWTGAIDLMAGARVRISDPWFVAPEAGLGVTSSVYTRFGVTVGFRL